MADPFHMGEGWWLVHNSEFCNSGYLWFGSGERLRMVWQDPQMFENWLKNTPSLSRVNNPLTHDEAAAVLEAALSMGMKIDLNPAGLAGLEKDATWGQMPHFTVESIYIPVRLGFKWP